MKTTAELYRHFVEKFRELDDLTNVSSLLSWDQQVYMPPKGAESRAQQLSCIKSIHHSKSTDPSLIELVQELCVRKDLDEMQAANVRLAWRDLKRELKVPATLVRAKTEQASRTREYWVRARAENNYAVVESELASLVKLTSEYADAIKEEGTSRYDALLDLYEPDGNALEIEQLFGRLRPQLIQLLQRIVDRSGNLPRHSLPPVEYPKAAQQWLCQEVIKILGFDTAAGRLDETVHPFCDQIGVGDVRLTTRYDEKDFTKALFAVAHETGHGLYDQGLPETERGLPIGRACSLGIHESQSLIWENHVLNSKSFWEIYFPLLGQAFPGATISVDRFYRTINKVQPSFIRVEADEITYSLHVILRFELERKLIEGSIPFSSLREAWNQSYQDSLGIRPSTDLEGILQDTHWYSGFIGYFPTYTLGALYAAELFGHFKKVEPDAYADFGIGDYKSFLNWLRLNVHQAGRLFNSQQLMTRILGRSPSEESFVSYLTSKYSEIYHL